MKKTLAERIDARIEALVYVYGSNPPEEVARKIADLRIQRDLADRYRPSN